MEENTIYQLFKKIENLEKEIRELKNRRITQDQIIPDVVKQRHVGEGVRFIRGGITAGKPTLGEDTLQGNAVYYDETVKKLYIWNNTNSAWEYVQFT